MSINIFERYSYENRQRPQTTTNHHKPPVNNHKPAQTISKRPQ